MGGIVVELTRSRIDTFFFFELESKQKGGIGEVILFHERYNFYNWQNGF